MEGAPLGNGIGRVSVNFDICGEAAMVFFALSIAGTRNAAPNPALAIINCLLVNICLYQSTLVIKDSYHSLLFNPHFLQALRSLLLWALLLPKSLSYIEDISRN
ncbi:MAG: hypothetical protein SAL70_01240 [Scytonema sp. PMC 1070.18]|nr:hypothetical protein [Scytonema sp. PMC 1070.18]